MRALRVGITGKIGSGKSTFSDVLREKGVEVIDTDTLAKEVMSSDPALRAELIALLGPDTYRDGTLNTSFVASQIFSDESKRHAVESLVHPAVMLEVERRIANATAGSVVAVESAILVQTGYDELFDVLVMVWASDESVIERGVASGKFSQEDIERRLKEQDYSDEIKGFADFLIENNSTKEALRSKCETIFGIIRAMAFGVLPPEPLRSIEPSEE